MRICSLHFEANCFKGKRLEWKIVAATLDERERERERERKREKEREIYKEKEKRKK